MNINNWSDDKFVDPENIPTNRRMEHILRDQLHCSDEEFRKVYFAFEKLIILKKIANQDYKKRTEDVFNRDKTTYQERMEWINEFLLSLGYDKKIFRDSSNYTISSDDYDYYYELKTPQQIKEEEAKRNERNIEDPSDQRTQ